MELSNNRTQRRIHQLALHLGPVQEDHALLRSSLCAIPCSAVDRESFQRRDNRTLFARQSSEGMGQFMRPQDDSEVVFGESVPTISAPKPATSAASAPSGSAAAVGSLPSALAGDDARGPSFAAVEPLFARPASDEPSYYVEKQVFAASDCETGVGSEMPKNFRRSGPAFDPRITVPCADAVKSSSNDKTRLEISGGFEWFPRMDVVESGTAYVITLELPGVSADGIHVEVSRSSLIVTGSRATEWWKLNSNGSNGGGTVYHRRELAQGPYRAVWRLPKNSDLNGITAEFIDGFLRVLVPKFKIMTYL